MKGQWITCIERLEYRWVSEDAPWFIFFIYQKWLKGQPFWIFVIVTPLGYNTRSEETTIRPAEEKEELRAADIESAKAESLEIARQKIFKLARAWRAPRKAKK